MKTSSNRPIIKQQILSHLYWHRGQEAFSITDRYLQNASVDELNTARSMMTWQKKERVLIPAQVFMRTLTHIYHHIGQIAAICRLLDKPIDPGLDYPII